MHTEITPSSRLLQLADFAFDVPTPLIAQQPADKREHAKLLLRTADGRILDHVFRDVSQLLPQGSVLILNDTQVFPSRLFAQIPPGMGKAEVFLLSRPDPLSSTVTAFTRPARKIKVGTVLQFTEGLTAEVVAQSINAQQQPVATLNFNKAGQELLEWLYQHAYTPLPPYIHRGQASPWQQSPDAERYQTVYARHEGSVAAPTAGLHFTNPLLSALQERGIRICPVTLHVGPGTFLPVRQEDIGLHAMHKELFFVPRSTLQEIGSARQEGRPLIAVGTTSLRACESLFAYAEAKGINPVDAADSWLETSLFIYPRTRQDMYKPRACDAIITNFHQPCSTLFMLICALVGYEEAFRIYNHAVRGEYRFYSYGDSSLLWL